MTHNLVSVIITTYQREFAMLEESVKSVLSQTYTPFELIVVDDNKPDTGYSEAIVDGLRAYPDVKYIKMPKNSGACAARNTGIMESEGEFCAFLDDDDLWAADKLKYQLAEFDDPDVGLVFCQGLKFSKNDIKNCKPYHTTAEFHATPTFCDLLSIDRIGSTSQSVIRKSCFPICGMFDSRLPARQDYEMWLRITKYGFKAKGVARALFYNRQHEGDQITKLPIRALNGNLIIYEKYRRDFDKDRRAKYIILTTIGGLRIVCGNPLRGVTAYAEAFFLRPVYSLGLLFRRKVK